MIAGFEVALFAAWKLLSDAKRRNPLSEKSLKWVNLAVVSLILSSLVAAGIFLHMGAVANVGGPGVLFGLVASIVLIVGVVVAAKNARNFLLASDKDREARR